ncbi:hypothetical protein D1AOALGA4SA_7847 [Olavius algarvensis Delta 1 endosymbiont]|nr:hypothetical protein D1AOALGA4SA_7847 [Olavius algarvensis Delta 1 endosymbiont]
MGHWDLFRISIFEFRIYPSLTNGVQMDELESNFRLPI